MCIKIVIQGNTDNVIMMRFLRIVVTINEPVNRILRKFLMNDICHILANPAFSS